MSATLNAGELEKSIFTEVRGSNFKIRSPTSPLLCSFLRRPDVSGGISNTPSSPAYNDKRPVWEQAAEAFSSYVNSGGEGDVLVFMPGGFEISQTIEAIRHTSEAKGFILLPLHGELEPKIRTPPWRVTTSAKLSLPRTSPKRR